MKHYCRLLCKDEEVEFFVDNILKIKDNSEKREAINLIVRAEKLILGYEDAPTLTHTSYRDFEFRDNKKREALRAQILSELIELKRLSDDDQITLGCGGAQPITSLKAEKKIFYVIGPPASGKSSISNFIADEIGGYIVDSDYAKRKLPEFNNQVSGASFVHEESDQIVFSYCKGNLLDHCISNGYNMVIPKIGHSLTSIVDFCNTMKAIGYDVYLISIDLDRVKATFRAYNRFKKTERYVPLSLIFDAYGNEPSLNYFKIKQKHSDIFCGFAQISTDVEPGKPFEILEENNISFLSAVLEVF